MLLAYSNVSKSFGAESVLENITFHIEDKEKIGIVGVNGAGKSTLLKLAMGELSPDEGQIIMPRNVTIGYFSQNLELDSEKSVYDELLSVFDPIIALEKELRETEKLMAHAQGEELENLMSKYSSVSHTLEENDAYSYESRLRGVIKGLGFTEEESRQKINELSGGQKTRAALGKLLLCDSDILLLDEATNHLDMDSVKWLEDYLRSYNKAVIIVSHDRYFLDRTVSKIVEIENKKSRVYPGNYTFYARKKQTDRENEYHTYINKQREIKRQEEVIRKLKEFNREKSIKRAESREKLLDKMEKPSAPDMLPEKIHFKITPLKPSGNDVLSVQNLAMDFDSVPLFRNVSFEIRKGEKVALIGPNGIGKTTLFRIILGQLMPSQGNVITGANVITGYYDQEQADLNLDKTIFDEISDTYPKLNNTAIRNTLAAFVFRGDDVFKTIDTLSGGEKGRVALAKIMLSNANFLLLDEPTNHLDINSKEILEEVIRGYEGTVLYISHDRYFINATADKVIELEKDKAVTYLGNYDYYTEKKASLTPADSVMQSAREDTETKLDWKKQKEIQTQQRKRENRLKKLEENIKNTEEKIDALDKLMEDESVYTDSVRSQEVYEEKESLEEQLMAFYEEQEELSRDST